MKTQFLKFLALALCGVSSAQLAMADRKVSLSMREPGRFVDEHGLAGAGFGFFESNVPIRVLVEGEFHGIALAGKPDVTKRWFVVTFNLQPGTNTETSKVDIAHADVSVTMHKSIATEERIEGMVTAWNWFNFDYRRDIDLGVKGEWSFIPIGFQGQLDMGKYAEQFNLIIQGAVEVAGYTYLARKLDGAPGKKLHGFKLLSASAAMTWVYKPKSASLPDGIQGSLTWFGGEGTFTSNSAEGVIYSKLSVGIARPNYKAEWYLRGQILGKSYLDDAADDPATTQLENHASSKGVLTGLQFQW